MAVCLATLCYYCLPFFQIVKLLCKSIVLWCEIDDGIREGASNQISFGPDTYKTIDLPGVQINDPALGKHLSLSFIPAASLSPPQRAF